MSSPTLHASTFTKEQFAAVVATIDDNAAHHIVWVDLTGYVHISAFPWGAGSPATWQKDQHDLKFRIETLCCGAGYMGKDASEDDQWMTTLHGWVKSKWADGAHGYVDHY